MMSNELGGQFFLPLHKIRWTGSVSLLWFHELSGWLIYNAETLYYPHHSLMIITHYHHISLSISSNTEFRKKLVMCYVCSIALYGSETWSLRKMEQRYLVWFKMWCGRRMENIKWSKKIIIRSQGKNLNLLSYPGSHASSCSNLQISLLRRMPL